MNAIGTLGFRGEALASIAAVAQVELLTRTAEEQVGTRYVHRRRRGTGAATTPAARWAPPVVVRDLFFNTPARMKFLKKDVTEGNAVAGVLDAVAPEPPGDRLSPDPGRQADPGDSRQQGLKEHACTPCLVEN